MDSEATTLEQYEQLNQTERLMSTINIGGYQQSQVDKYKIEMYIFNKKLPYSTVISEYFFLSHYNSSTVVLTVTESMYLSLQQQTSETVITVLY